MNKFLLYLIGICLFLSACVQAPVIKEGEYSLIKSNYPVVIANGVEIKPAYKLDIPAGENTLVIIYNTYRFDYYCTFTWKAEAGTAYEVTDQYNKYPLTLYRWVRTNSLWASRLDPVDPLGCIPEERQKKRTK
jgi:hypothetical protein